MVRTVFVHPDLGIGGAERLVVDAALALKRKGHDVCFFTAHHDPSHCFPETRDGQLDVTCVGDWLPRTTFGALAAFWAYVRMIYVALYLVLFSGIDYDVAFVDQVSACVPFLRLRKGTKILFYCHFPDQLLTQRRSFLKRSYRLILDWIEEKTTGQADGILVNSHFTSGVFRDTFRSLRVSPTVLYPSLDFSKFEAFKSLSLKEVGLEDVPLAEDGVLFLSLNRYERKKNLSLALDSLKVLIDSLSPQEASKVHLVMAGGYDHRVPENVEHHEELQSHAELLSLSEKVTFLRSPSEKQKVALLKSARGLLYTPENEHFGIVPLEAMFLGTPVVAVNSGGPKETVLNEETGFLCPPEAKNFATAMETLTKDPQRSDEMGKAGRERVNNNFAFIKFSEKLNYVVQGLMDERRK